MSDLLLPPDQAPGVCVTLRRLFLGDVTVDCGGDGASAGLGAAKVATLDHLGFDGLGPVLRLAACWKARRAGRKSAHADLDMEKMRVPSPLARSRIVGMRYPYTIVREPAH